MLVKAMFMHESRSNCHCHLYAPLTLDIVCPYSVAVADTEHHLRGSGGASLVLPSLLEGEIGQWNGTIVISVVITDVQCSYVVCRVQFRQLFNQLNNNHFVLLSQLARTNQTFTVNLSSHSFVDSPYLFFYIPG